MEDKGISEAGQLPDWTSGRRWLIENYENYHSRFVTALDVWARNVKDVYPFNMKLWLAMNRVVMLIRYRKPVIQMEDYLITMEKWDKYNKTNKIPDKEALLDFAHFLDEALYNLRLVYDEETEKPYVKAYWRGKDL